MRKIAMIPARYRASRFPGKLLQLLGDKPVLAHTYINAVKSGLFDEVAIVTDSDEIENELKPFGAVVLRSRLEHECGTDRIAEQCHRYNPDDIIVNIQGDEPFTSKDLLKQLIDFLISHPEAQVATLKHAIHLPEDIANPNFVKVVCTQENRVLIFSRAAVPYRRDEQIDFKYYRHIGIYAFRNGALQQFASWPPSRLELLEKQEALRFLEHDVPVYCLETQEQTFGIDVPEDLVKANEYLNNQQ